MGILNIEENNSNDLEKKNHVPQINIIFYKSEWSWVHSIKLKNRNQKFYPTTINIKIEQIILNNFLHCSKVI